MSDFDFCINFILDNNENKIESEIFYSLGEMDKRWLFLSHYKAINKYNNTNICSNKNLKKDELNVWTDGTIIKHILVI